MVSILDPKISNFTTVNISHSHNTGIGKIILKIYVKHIGVAAGD